MNEWMNEWVSERMNEWVSERMNERTNERLVIPMSKYVGKNTCVC